MMFEECSEADWRRLAEKALKGAPFEQLVTQTEDGVAYGPVHAPSPVRQVFRETLAACSIAQRIDDPDSDRAHTQTLADLEGGADALVLVLDGAPSAHGFGLPVEAVGAALGGVLLDIVHLRVEAGTATASAAQELRKLAASQSLALDGLDLDLCTDLLGPLALAGKLPDDDIRLRDTFASGIETSLDQGFRGRLIEADGRVYHEAGASEAQELAAVLASALYAMRALEHRGDTLRHLPSMIGFTLAADQKQFLVMAKLRALRLLWQRVQELSGMSTPAPARIHVETSFRMMAATDPHSNILRTTVASFAAVTGGADRICVLPFTSANGLPEANARRLACNTQLILRDEAGLGSIADPAAGAGGMEMLTEGLAAAAWREFRQIEREGGLFATLRDGQLQRRIAVTARTRAEAITDKREPIVGVTHYPLATPREACILMPRPEPAPMPRATSTPLPAVRLSEAAEVAK